MKKENRYNFYKEAKFYEIPDDADGLHPILNFIKFDKGCAIATNGKRLVVAPVNEISNLYEDDIEKLNGHLIDKILFKNLIKQSMIIEISDNRIKCKPLHPMTDIETISFEIPLSSDFKWKFPPYEKIMVPPKIEASEEISFDADNLHAICAGVGKHYPIITPNGLDGSIKVRFQESEIKAFIMSINYKENIFY